MNKGKVLLPETSWSLIERSRGEGSSARLARDEFTSRYYAPVQAYIRAIVKDADEAEELVQDFFAKRILKGGILSSADPAKGKFRHFLKQSVRYFLASRPRTRPVVRPDQFEGGWDVILPAGDVTPDRAYHMAWVQRLVSNATEKVHVICTQRDLKEHFEIFRGHYLSDPPSSWEDLAKKFGLKNGKQARHRAETVAWHFRSVIRAEIAADTEFDPEIDEEIANLISMC